MAPGPFAGVGWGIFLSSVQALRYGCAPGALRFTAFVILQGTRWLDPIEVRKLAPDLPWVPVVGEAVPCDLEALRTLADGPSLVDGADHLREGIVVRPLVERTDPEVGRVCLKLVSAAYLAEA